jgi:hypothetical protein
VKCTDLAKRIQKLRPTATVSEVARLCLLLSNTKQELGDLADDAVLTNAWKDIDLRMRAATDQHAAMTADLERLELVDSPRFTSQQIWQLVRTFNVQSQILGLYLGRPQSKNSS